MDGTLSSILNFFLDKTRSFGIKTAIGITFIAATVLFDLGFGISYNAHLSNKIEQLKSIQSLKSNYRLDTLKLAQIKELEDEIISRQHYSDFLRLDLFFNSERSYTNDQNDSQSATPNTNAKKPILSRFWMVVSSNYLLLFVFPILLFLPLFPGQKTDGKTIVGWLAVNVLWVALMFFITSVAYLIPVLFGNPVYNYLLNFLVHTAFMVTAGVMSKKKKKK